MRGFVLTDSKYSQEQLDNWMGALPLEEKESIVTAVNFVKRTKRWARPGIKGTIVITSPRGRLHVFSGDDLTHKGYADYLPGYGGMWMDSKLAEFMEIRCDSDSNEFITFMEEVHHAVVKTVNVHNVNTQ